jgi:AraC-like DNA-binding protein
MTTFSPLAKIDETVTRIHVHGLDEASQQLAPFIQVGYVQLQRGRACFHGAMAKLGNTYVGDVEADRDKVEFIQVPRGRTVIVVPTRGLARQGTTDVAPGHAMVAHGPGQLIAYTDREYQASIVSMPDCSTASLVSQPPAAQGALQAGAPVTVLPMSGTELRRFQRYVREGLQQRARECIVSNKVSRLPASDTLLVNLCHSWLRDFASRVPSANASTARCHAAIRARQYIDEHLDQPLTLPIVCHASYSSPRALEYGFREIFGVSPITYIRCARLARVRRELCLSTQMHGRVTQLALKWGFWHLSQFSSDYYELFGELPSTTLGRAAGRLVPLESTGCEYDRAADSIAAREPAQVRSTAQRGFDGGNDLLGRTGFHQYGVEEL